MLCPPGEQEGTVYLTMYWKESYDLRLVGKLLATALQGAYNSTDPVQTGQDMARFVPEYVQFDGPISSIEYSLYIGVYSALDVHSQSLLNAPRST